MRPTQIITLISLLALFLAGCSGALRWSEQTYTVQEGDTLYSIAFRHDLDYRQLAEWNDIGQGYLIFPGDELVLSPQAAQARSSSASSTSSTSTTSTASSGSASDNGERPSQERTPRPSPPSAPAERRENIRWAWPLEGEIINAFGEGARNTGIRIAAEEGVPVHAAASGRVVYTGSGLIGYGKLIIIKHDDVYLSAYGHNQDILVDEGDEVAQGDQIARVGLGRGNRSMLHFEIRSQGEAVDPADYLPR